MPLPDSVVHFVNAPRRLPFRQFLQDHDDRFVGFPSALIPVRRSTEIHHVAGLALAELVAVDGQLDQFAALARLYNFFSTMSLSTRGSRLRSAYICLRRRFSSSSSFSRFKALASIPLYLARHL